MSANFITIIILLPFLGALFQVIHACFRSESNSLIPRWVAIGCSTVAGVLGVSLVLSMKGMDGVLQSAQQVDWIASYAISFSVGLDGLNTVMLLLISIVFPLLVIFQWEEKRSIRGMVGLLLLTQSALTGAVCAQDLFLMFFFWAISPVPLFLMISIWGDKEREKAAFYYIMSAVVGNAFFLAALILIYYSSTPYTFSIAELSSRMTGQSSFSLLGIDLSVSTLAFILLCLGIAIRIPLFPFHGWLSFSAVQSSAVVVILLTGVFPAVGLYLFSKIGFALFFDYLKQYQHFLIILGIVNLLFGALSALFQKEFRILFSFTLLCQAGLILIGLSSTLEEGVVGAIYQQLALGLGVCGLGIVGGLMFERSGNFQFLDTKETPIFAGLVTSTPMLSLVTAIFIISLIGIPGFGGFVGQSLIVMGGFSAGPDVAVFVALSRIILAYGWFSVFRKVFLVSEGVKSTDFSDLSRRERLVLFPLVVVLFLLGIFPQILINIIRPSVLQLIGGNS